MVFLYELALQLGVRSTDLVDRARAHGVELGPSAYLTPEQVSWLAAMMAAPPTSPAPGAVIDDATAGAVIPEQTPPAGGAPPPPPPPPLTAVEPAPPTAAPLVGSWVAGGPPRPEGAPSIRSPHDGVAPPRSKAAVVLFVSMPIVLVAAVLAYVFFAGGDDDTTDARSSGGTAGTVEMLDEAAEAENEKEAGPKSVDGITDLVAYCAAWNRLEEAIDAVEPGDPSDFGAVRRAILEVAPASAAFIADVEPVTTGELREEIAAMEEYLEVAVPFMERMPATTAELTAAHAEEMTRFDAEHPRAEGGAVDAASRHC